MAMQATWEFIQFYGRLVGKAFRLWKSVYGWLLMAFPIIAVASAFLFGLDITTKKSIVAIGVSVAFAIAGALWTNFVDYRALEDRVGAKDILEDLAQLRTDGYTLLSRNIGNDPQAIEKWQADKKDWIKKAIITTFGMSKDHASTFSNFNISKMENINRFHHITPNTNLHPEFATLEQYLDNLDIVMERHRQECRASKL